MKLALFSTCILIAKENMKSRTYDRRQGAASLFYITPENSFRNSSLMKFQHEHVLNFNFDENHIISYRLMHTEMMNRIRECCPLESLPPNITSTESGFNGSQHFTSKQRVFAFGCEEKETPTRLVSTPGTCTRETSRKKLPRLSHPDLV